MTVTGPRVDIGGIGSIELVDAKNAQEYIDKLAAEFIAQDGGQHLYLVHDGETGTSHELIGAAINALYEGKDFATTDLSNVLTRIAEVSCVVRIWDAGAIMPLSHRPHDLKGLPMLVDVFVEMAGKGHIKYLRSQLATRSRADAL